MFGQRPLHNSPMIWLENWRSAVIPWGRSIAACPDDPVGECWRFPEPALKHKKKNRRHKTQESKAALKEHFEVCSAHAHTHTHAHTQKRELSELQHESICDMGDRQIHIETTESQSIRENNMIVKSWVDDTLAAHKAPRLIKRLWWHLVITVSHDMCRTVILGK